ncbi:MAG: hypothetical protein WCF28_12225 [Methanobacterium sp.]
MVELTALNMVKMMKIQQWIIRSQVLKEISSLIGCSSQTRCWWVEYTKHKHKQTYICMCMCMFGLIST